MAREITILLFYWMSQICIQESHEEGCKESDALGFYNGVHGSQWKLNRGQGREPCTTDVFIVDKTNKKKHSKYKLEPLPTVNL